MKRGEPKVSSDYEYGILLRFKLKLTPLLTHPGVLRTAGRCHHPDYQNQVHLCR